MPETPVLIKSYVRKTILSIAGGRAGKWRGTGTQNL